MPRPIIMNSDEMYRFFADFDAIKEKFFYHIPKITDYSLAFKLFQTYKSKNPQKYWSIQQAIDSFLTLEKLYNTCTEDSIQYCKLLEKITTELLGHYVNIDGIQELFHASYFYFEWMMHLEYEEHEHDYSYYRDHYLHQIRNLYEMFVFLNDLNMWTTCMELYKTKNNTTSDWIRNSIQSQLASMSTEEKELLEAVNNSNSSENFFEEFCYHYLFEAVAIVSALAHDIGYPICYMQRTVNKLQHFLPLSYLFIESQDQIPKIRSMLKGSLLFEVIGETEVEKRLLEHDHGTYSAIILLFHYYDNGHIFKLAPLKRMVIELSALVIYNHTLKYHFQNKKNYYRYQNVFNENPLSYLFRLCDDLQEWERVYFDVSRESNFFICPNCKMPLVRNLSAKENHTESGEIPYQCFCGIGGINTNLFSYRRLINAAPFKSLSVLQDSNDENSWKMQLHCELRALLQMAKYNPRFAIQRVKGINEIKALLKNQADFPLTFVETFISCNPIAIKAEILRNFADRLFISDSDITLTANKPAEWAENLYYFVLNTPVAENIWEAFHSLTADTAAIKGTAWISGWTTNSTSKSLLLQSLQFYLFIVLLAEKIQNARTHIIDSESFNEKNLSEQLYLYFNRVAEHVGKLWHIYDVSSLALISDYFQQVFCRVDFPDFLQHRYEMLYYHYLNVSVDMPNIVKNYICNDMYQQICNSKCRNQENQEMLFDYYSDYYFFFLMDEL